MYGGGQQVQPPIADISLAQDIVFLERYGVDRNVLVWAQERAEAFGVTPATSLIANGLISEIDYYKCVAAELELEFTIATAAHGQPFFSPPNPHDLQRMSRMMQLDQTNEINLSSQFGQKQLHIAPDCSQMDALKKWLAFNRELKPRLKITPLSSNRIALEERCSLGLFSLAVDGLRKRFPSLSARQVITPKQAVVLVLSLQLLIVLAFFSTPGVFLLLHLTATLFYLGCVALRVLATIAFNEKARRPLQEIQFDRSHDHLLPTYSVLVPLYDEHEQVGDLVAALASIDWPKERLEIKLVCEAEDTATVLACHKTIAETRLSYFAVVEVPAGAPQTKPKALAYALPLCTGSLVVVYDAEDRPDPMQLREAYRKFESGPPNLACLQAPLIIHNYNESWLSRLFAIEYSALFDGLIPALSAAGTPVPLGGTSNHFKRNVLDDLSGWDPYNVTEDADFGIRMARAGYRTGVLTLPTYEEAPISLSVWIKQRTRWFKGWYQTWFVHMRDPFKTMGDLGMKNSIIFQLMIAGMAITTLVHPLLLYFIFMDVTGLVENGTWRSFAGPLVALDVTTVILGYLSFAWLAWRTLPVRNLAKLRVWVVTVPLYWLLLSVAAWRAVWQLMRNPHFWEKTPHRLSGQADTKTEGLTNEELA